MGSLPFSLRKSFALLTNFRFLNPGPLVAPSAWESPPLEPGSLGARNGGAGGSAPGCSGRGWPPGGTVGLSVVLATAGVFRQDLSGGINLGHPCGNFGVCFVIGTKALYVKELQPVSSLCILDCSPNTQNSAFGGAVGRSGGFFGGPSLLLISAPASLQTVVGFFFF